MGLYGGSLHSMSPNAAQSRASGRHAHSAHMLVGLRRSLVRLPVPVRMPVRMRVQGSRFVYVAVRVNEVGAREKVTVVQDIPGIA